MPRSFLVRKSACSRRRPNYSELHDSSPEFTFQQPYDQAHLLAAIPPPEVLNPTASLPTLIWDSLLAPQAQPIGWAALLPQEVPKAAELTSLSDDDSGKGSQPPSPPSPAPSSFSSTSASSLEAEGYVAFPGLGRLPAQLAGLSVAKDSQTRKAFSCKYCNKEYLSLGALKMHIRSHTLPCVCGTCGKAFSRPWLLQGHVRTHTGEKPFSCSHCSRAFADRSNLRAHLQTHSDVKKYQCKTCSRTFSRMSLLHKHQESGCSGGPPLTLKAPSASPDPPPAIAASILPTATEFPSELPLLAAFAPQGTLRTFFQFSLPWCLGGL